MKLQIKRILYATDLSQNSSDAFLFAVDLARTHDASIIALHAVEHIRPDAHAYMNITPEMERGQEERAIEVLKKQLKRFCRRAEAQFGTPCAELVSKALVLRGHPTDVILSATNEEECDVIVLGSRGKGFLAQTLLGSVSNAVLRHARKPVFVIPLPSDTTNEVKLSLVRNKMQVQ